MRIVHVKFTKDNFEVFMTENDAKKFVEGFPRGSFIITPVEVKTFDNAIELWDSFVGNL